MLNKSKQRDLVLKKSTENGTSRACSSKVVINLSKTLDTRQTHLPVRQEFRMTLRLQQSLYLALRHDLPKARWLYSKAQLVPHIIQHYFQKWSAVQILLLVIHVKNSL